MTVQNCASLAYAGGYPFFAVQYGSQCFAGVSLTAAEQYGPSEACNMACAGNASETCGEFPTTE